MLPISSSHILEVERAQTVNLNYIINQKRSDQKIWSFLLYNIIKDKGDQKMSSAYTTYIITHVGNVLKAYFWLKDHNIISEELVTQLNLHDTSKYSDQEYDAYDKYFYGDKTKKVEENFNVAWLHHIHNNPHHWQHWVLVNDDDGTHALEMPKEYVIEMICDWWAFSHKSGNLYEIFDWYKSHKKNMILHDKTKKLVEELLDKIKEELDKETINE